jgi:hypothetical protein
MSEAPFNPVAPALANAVRDATGVRLTALPLRRDRVYEQLQTALASSAFPAPTPTPAIASTSVTRPATSALPAPPAKKE